MIGAESRFTDGVCGWQKKLCSNKDKDKHYTSFALNHLAKSHETTINSYLEPKLINYVATSDESNTKSNSSVPRAGVTLNSNPYLAWR